MKQAETFNYVMMALWDEQDVPKEAIAIASYVKTHGRRNHENAFDVLDIMWPDAACIVRAHGVDNESEHDVTFPDGSRATVLARKGIGCGIELPQVP